MIPKLPPYSNAVALDETRAVLGAFRSLSIVDRKTGAPIATRTMQAGAPTAIAISPDKKSAALATHSGASIVSLPVP